MIWTHTAAALASLAIGFGAGWKVQGWRWSAADGERATSTAEVQRLRQMAADAAAGRHEAARATLAARRIVITREVDRVVEKPVYRNVCLDADGLRILAAAVGAASAPGEPAPAVPAADDAR